MAHVDGTPNYQMGEARELTFRGQELKLHSLSFRIPAFLIDATEVTVGHWRTKMGGSVPPPLDRAPPPDNYPITQLTFDNITAFAERSGKRLLDEAEHEFVATRRTPEQSRRTFGVRAGSVNEVGLSRFPNRTVSTSTSRCMACVPTRWKRPARGITRWATAVTSQPIQHRNFFELFGEAFVPAPRTSSSTIGLTGRNSGCRWPLGRIIQWTLVFAARAACDLEPTERIFRSGVANKPEMTKIAVASCPNHCATSLRRDSPSHKNLVNLPMKFQKVHVVRRLNNRVNIYGVGLRIDLPSDSDSGLRSAIRVKRDRDELRERIPRATRCFSEFNDSDRLNVAGADPWQRLRYCQREEVW